MWPPLIILSFQLESAHIVVAWFVVGNRYYRRNVRRGGFESHSQTTNDDVCSLARISTFKHGILHKSILLSRCICLLESWVVNDFETADIQNHLGGSSPLFPAKMMVSKQKNPQTRVQD